MQSTNTRMPGGFTMVNGIPRMIRQTVGSVRFLKELTIENAKKMIGKNARLCYYRTLPFSEIVKIRDVGDMIIAYLKNGIVININILEIQ